MKSFLSLKTNFQNKNWPIFHVKLGRLWGQYFQTTSRKIIAKKPQFRCYLFSLRFYMREDLETYSSNGQNIIKSSYRVNRKSNIYYLRGLVRVTVLTPKKHMSNFACVRSKIRRRLREAVRQVLLYRNDKGFPYLPVVPYDLFLVANMDVLHEDWKTLLYFVEKGLQKALEILNNEKVPENFVSMKISDLESLSNTSFQMKNHRKPDGFSQLNLDVKSTINLQKQASMEPNDLEKLQFIRYVLRLSNSPCSTSVTTLSRNINFLLEHYKLRKITLYDIKTFSPISRTISCAKYL